MSSSACCFGDKADSLRRGKVPACVSRVVPQHVPGAERVAPREAPVRSHCGGHVDGRLRPRVSRSSLGPVAEDADHDHSRLGDRHGENILFDSMSGATVHVDFNCLFDKGRTFEVPERVPFRLTHNMVDGLGVTGTEGVFRKACEVTMRILRLNKESLRSVLETFVHDPLVDWLPNAKKKVSHP